MAGTDVHLAIPRIVIAATRVEEMASFYGAALGCRFEPTPAYGTTLYRTELRGLSITLCPNSIAGVVAEQSRHQMTFGVPDVAAALARLVAAGHTAAEPERDERGPVRAQLVDPDGNTLELARTS